MRAIQPQPKPQAHTKHCVLEAKIASQQSELTGKDFGKRARGESAKSPDYCKLNEAHSHFYPQFNCKSKEDLRNKKQNIDFHSKSSSTEQTKQNCHFNFKPSSKSPRQIEHLQAGKLLWSARRLAASGRHGGDHRKQDFVSNVCELRERVIISGSCDSERQSDNVALVVESQLSSHLEQAIEEQQDLNGRLIVGRARRKGRKANGFNLQLSRNNSQSGLLLLLLISSFSLLVVQLALSGSQSGYFKLVQGALVANWQNNHNDYLNNINRPATQTSINQIQTHQQQQAGVPYKTVHVTQVCEWKSNLFVPKSNDIHFAQPFVSSREAADKLNNNPSSTTFTSSSFNHLNSNLKPPESGQQQHEQFAPSNGFPMESSIVYESPSLFRQEQRPSQETLNANTSDDDNNLRPATIQLVNSNKSNGLNANSRTTIERNDQKALVLALPIEFSQQFAGFEQACSIRLVVPENMRILAQLTSRRLKFEYEAKQATATSHNNNNLQQPPFFGLPPSPAFLWPQPPPTSSSNFNFNANANANQQHEATLWLNVSSDPFVELDQRTIETDANELAFRFILERNAHKKFPDLRFQAVVTAFQTLSENSDLNNGGQLQAAANQGEQFICDQQRLISANLACDGYKNCQDGHDEEAQACALVRHTSSAANSQNSHSQQPSSMDHDHQAAGNQSTGDDNSDSFFWPGWFSSSPSNKWKQQSSLEPANNREWASITGFLLGLLLVLILLLACILPICYCIFLLLCASSTSRLRFRNFLSHESNSNNLSPPRDTSRRRSTRTFKNIADFLRKPSLTFDTQRSQRSNQAHRAGRGNRISIGRLEQERLNEMRRQNANNERRLSALIESSSSSQIVAQQQAKTDNNGNLAPATATRHLPSILKRPASVQPVSGFPSSGVAANMQLQQRPLEPPPNIPERPIRRGALASSLRSRGSSASRQAAITFPSDQAGFFGHQDKQAASRPPPQQYNSPQFKPTPTQRLTRPTRPIPPPAMSPQSNHDRQQAEQEQRVTTYHFSSASTSFSRAYLEQLPTTDGRRATSGFHREGRGNGQRQQQQQQQAPAAANDQQAHTSNNSRAKKAASNLTSLI